MKKLISLLFACLVLSACASADLKGMYSIENFQKDNTQVENPEAVIYVKNDVVTDKKRSVSGLTWPWMPEYTFPVGVCIAKAIKNITPNVNVYLLNSEQEIVNTNNIPMIQVDKYDVKIRDGWAFDGCVCIIKAELRNLKNNRKIEIEGIGGNGIPFGNPLYKADIATEKACNSIAKEIFKFMVDEKIKITHKIEE